MKVSFKEDKKFQPITLTICLETPEELADMYAIFNHGVITDSLCIDHRAIRDCLRGHGELNYQKSFYKLDKLLSEYQI